ncbi:MAG: aminoglycoside phosphotransferase [Actinomycetota bacterium]|nr:aminoglycoside phosphotransferase [Actinomycetota bacterium]
MTADLSTALGGYIARQRWFAGKDDTAHVRDISRLPWLDAGGAEPHVRVELVTVSSGGRALVYSVPLSYYSARRSQLEHAYVGEVEDASRGWLHAYDALHDRTAIGRLVRGFGAGAPDGGLVHHTVGPLDLAADVSSLMLTGEQSNSSIVLGDDLLLKVFRKVEAGRNPDIEVHVALASTGSREVAPLRGWIESDPSAASGGHDLAMLQDFLRTGTDGWQYARASVRDLLVEGDLHADEVGGDFAGEAERLGATVAQLHIDLAAAMPTAQWGPAELAELAVRLRHRLDEAASQVPELAEHADALQRGYDDLASLDTVPVQRVHGDLHLGQSLRAVDGWRIIDFEGEPAKPLAERRRLDSPVRDVAGMLRSFDYAAHSVALPEAQDHQQAHRASEWAQRNRGAFCTGYTSRGAAPIVATLLRAYEIDKAVYEVGYEKGNRPSWVPIPLAAIRRLAREAAA